MMRRRAELQQEVANVFGVHIETPADRLMLETIIQNSTKEELMDKLAAYYRKQDPNRKPLLKQLPTMLARNVKDLSKEEFDELLTSPDWVYEEKLDGCRAKLHFTKDGCRIDSRHRSVTTYEYAEKTDCFPHFRDWKVDWAVGTILDGEVLMPVNEMNSGKTQTEGSLTTTASVFNSSPERSIELQMRFGPCMFVAFDILCHNGADIRSLPFGSRRFRLGMVTGRLHHASLKITTLFTCDPRTHYEQILQFGGEGLMLKNLHAPYPLREGQRTRAMYKWKKSYDIDCFITGFVPGEGEFSGLVGALLVSIMDRERPREIGAIQPGTLDIRREMSHADGSLKDAYYSKVVEVNFQDWTKNKRMRHAILKRFRPEKNPYECNIDQGGK